jgi:diguanylate cyclase (GGDEF)-like protein/PAS domain S-box-containing protein
LQDSIFKSDDIVLRIVSTAMFKLFPSIQTVNHNERNRILLGWGIAWLLIVALVFSSALVKIQLDRNDLLDQARSESVSRANTAADQVLRTVSQIDQLSLAIKYQWEHRSAPLDLDDQYRKGVYQKTIYPVVINSLGYAVSSTRQLPKNTYMGDLPFFIKHSKDPQSGLLISPPAEGRGGFSGKKIIRFTRSFNRPDGSFDGVVLIAIEVDYLTSFYAADRLLVGDFISVYFTDGLLLASQSGGGSTKSLFNAFPHFSLSKGSVRQPEGLFIDQRSRLVSWKTIEDYPLVVVAAIDAENATASYASTRLTYLNIASAFSVLMLLFAAVGAYTHLRNIDRQRRESEIQTTFRLAVDGAHEAFYMVHPTYHNDGRIHRLFVEDCNERAAEMAGYPRAKLIGKCLTEIYQGKALQDLYEFFSHVLSDGFVEDEFHVSNGKRHTAGWFQRRAIRSGNGVAITIRDVSDARQQAETLAVMARTDSLTGLPNRHWLNDYLPNALKKSIENNHRMALLYVDLDNFKDINDSLGHKSGDELIIAVAQSLRLALRSEDYLARIGGDEFLIVISHLEEITDAIPIAEKSLQSISLENSVAQWRGFVPKASIGISVFPDHGEDIDSLLRAADIAMYQAKSEGKSQFRFYNEEFSQKIRDRISTERALDLAIQNDEFVIYYQPRAFARNGEFASMEALVRWRDPHRGLISPADFIPIAEQSRLIIPLGDLVIRKVCKQLAIWREQGSMLRPVSINVSALQLIDDGLRLSITKNLDHYNLPTSLVAIELTESSMLDETGIAIDELKRLHDMGIELQIDDFGTGYSSLSKLQSLDIDVVKIDQSFVHKLASDHQSRALCETIVSIGRSLEIAIVAEGVETVEQLEILQAMNCDEVQGYLISRPVPPEDIPTLIAKKFF